MYDEYVKKRPYYPILVDLEDKKAVVIGGGAVARRKIDTLLDYGAEIDIIARDMIPEIEELVKTGVIRFLGKEFEREHLKGAFIVIAATDDSSLNHRISKDAREMGLLINAVDQPQDCNFIVPSILRRGDLIIAVSTSGKSPAMAKSIREGLEDRFGDEYEALLNIMGRIRSIVLSKGLSQEENRKIFKKLTDSDIINSIKNRAWAEVASKLGNILQASISIKEIIQILKKDR